MQSHTEKVGNRVCDQCRKILKFGVPQPQCPVLMMPTNPIDFCDDECETRYKSSGGNRKKIEEIQSERIE